MQRYRLPLTREVPIPSDEEAQLPQPIAYYYLASDVDARIAELEEQNRKMRHALKLIKTEGFSMDDRRVASEALTLVGSTS